MAPVPALQAPVLLAQGERQVCIVMDLPPYVIHGLCNFPGLVSLLGEGVRGQAAERHMGPGLIVISPPVFDPLPGIGHGEEP